MSTYYFSNAGNDITGDGSIGNTYATTSKVDSLNLIAGDTVLFKRGDTFICTDIVYSEGGDVGNPITFGAYGTGDRPILTAFGSISGWTVSGNWTNVSGNIWRLNSTNGLTRLWINGTEATRSFNSGVTSTDVFYHNGSSLYVYSLGNPATTFSNMECNTLDKIFYCNYGNITFENLDLQAAHNCIRISNDADNFIIQNCNIGWNSDGRGLLASNSTIGMSCDNVLVRDCVFDSNDKMMYVGVEAQSAFAGIDISNGCSNWEIYNCYFKNWGHSCIDHEASLVDIGYYSDNISIHDNYFTCPDIYYGRAIGAGGRQGYVSNIKVYNNYSFSCPTSTQINGGEAKVHHNIFDNNNRESLITAKPYATGACIGLSNSSYNMSLYGTEFYNNVFANAFDAGIDFGGYDGSPDMSGVTFANNIVYNCGSSTRSNNYQLYIYDQVSMKGNTFKNNLFYKSGVSDVIYYGNDATNDYPHTVAEFNAENGNEGDIISGNIQLDPLFVSNDDFHLLLGSPCINTGIDVGLSYNGSAPDIGAFEYGVYYFDSINGNDSWSGTITSPYKSISKLNSILSTVTSGTTIYLKRGSEWSGSTISAYKSGTALNPITINAYGSGQDPLLTGFQTVTDWIQSGTTGIWYKTVTTQSAPNMVLIDDVQYAMGKYPSTGWNYYESHIGETQIIDNQLNGTPNWAGAQLILRTYDWAFEKYTITNHSNNTITFSASTYSDGTVRPTAPLIDGWGYFIQNDIKTLTDYGDWYYNTGTSTFYMYFGAISPTSVTVKISIIDELIVLHDYMTYMNISNLQLVGANTHAIYLTYGCLNNTISDCNIDFSGYMGIYNYSSQYSTFDNITVNHSNDIGIFVASWYCHNSKVINSTILNTGLLIGQGDLGFSSGTGLLLSDCDNGLAQYNVIMNCGYCAIMPGGRGSNIITANNYINNFCINKTDGGGIYTGNDASHDMIIEGNIVLNGIGGVDGEYYGQQPSGARGIYPDFNDINGLIVRDNTVAYCTYCGIFTFMGQNIDILNNTVYDCEVGWAFQENDPPGPPYTQILNITAYDNIFVAKEPTQYTLSGRIASGHTYAGLGTFDRNTYARPIDDVTSMKPCIYLWDCPPISFSTWKNSYGQDPNGHQSPTSISNTSQLRFEYNSGKTNLTINLNRTYMKIDGSILPNGSEIILEPYTSIILLEYGNYKIVSKSGKLTLKNGKIVIMN